MTRIILGLSLALSTLTSCHPQEKFLRPKKIPTDTLFLALPDKIENLDWNMSMDQSAAIIETNLMEGLTGLELTRSEVKVKPALAESWDTSDGGLQYVFHLRGDSQWSDGKPLVAQNFVDSIQRLLISNAPWAESLFVIRGGEGLS